MFTPQPLKRGAWFCCIKNLTKFELMLNKLIRKSRRLHPTNSFVTNLFSSFVFKAFVEESMILSDPDMIANIMASSPELPQCIKIYNPKTRVVVFTEYEIDMFTGDARKYVDVWTFGRNSPEVAQFPTSMRHAELPAKLRNIFTTNNPGIDIVRNRKLHENWNNMCMMCKTTEVRLKTCARCKTARYCSPECQKEDWTRGHKHACITMGEFDSFISKQI